MPFAKKSNCRALEPFIKLLDKFAALPKTGKLNCALLLLMTLALLALTASLYSQIQYYVVVDSPLWVDRYARYAANPWVMPSNEQHQPLTGMGNRIVIGLPGFWLWSNFSKVNPIACYRAVQITFFFAVVGACCWLLTGFAGLKGVKRFALLFPGILIFSYPPQIAYLVRVINYDTCSALFMLLAISFFLAAQRLFMSAKTGAETAGKQRQRAYACLALSGAFSAVSFSCKLYGIFSLVYLSFLCGFLPVSKPLLKNRLKTMLYAWSANWLGFFAGLFLITNSAWAHPSILLRYFGFFNHINITTAAIIPFAVFFLAAQAIIVTCWHLSRKRIEVWRRIMFRRSLARLAPFLAVFGVFVACFLAQKTSMMVTTSREEAKNFPKVWETAHMLFSYGHSSSLQERLANLFRTFQVISWIQPEGVLIFLACLSILAFRKKIKAAGFSDWAILGFVAFSIASTAFAMVWPVPRYLLPISYGLSAWLAFSFFRNFSLNSKIWTVILACFACNSCLIMARIAPHFYGYANVFRNRDISNATEYMRLNSLDPGWGSGNDMAMDYLQSRGLLRNGLKIQYDYYPAPQKRYGKKIQFVFSNARPKNVDYVILTMNNSYRNKEFKNIIDSCSLVAAIGYSGLRHTLILDPNNNAVN